MSIMEQIAHDLFDEHNIKCIVEGCGNIPQCAHIIEQSKANAKIAGQAIDLIGVNILPQCAQHHAEEHRGIMHNYKKSYDEKLLKLARIQLHRCVVRCGR